MSDTKDQHIKELEESLAWALDMMPYRHLIPERGSSQTAPWERARAALGRAPRMTSAECLALPPETEATYCEYLPGGEIKLQRPGVITHETYLKELAIALEGLEGLAEHVRCPDEAVQAIAKAIEGVQGAIVWLGVSDAIQERYWQVHGVRAKRQAREAEKAA